ncbi:MAG: anhydro-N-acetylmuramic acid kinase [Pseudohongiella sp.]|nr:anhydro-N-acetylmuramic acid kinase [Pseudohongiella sp.]MDO9521685.1 anhydro-N-acetylmuramic acid kinase [Pseudohongiella sp.]MDP2128276.1 anhydro-N-acetylmuramic acid kinase [Pseudohongiella sp.]
MTAIVDAELFIGIISGTSMDGIDCAITKLESGRLCLLASSTVKYPCELRDALFSACSSPTISLSELGQLDISVGKAFADAINQMLDENQINSGAIKAIGSHGQTLFHLPTGEHPFSLQIGDPNTIAERTGITTVADFRRRDMAAGGQGAPLAPLFHQYFFHKRGACRCVLNIGGISNITWLATDADSPPTGFDTGPGNVLMDLWATRWLDKPYDNNGEWAASGDVHQELLQLLLQEPYFSVPSPKSTGRELFNAIWLEERLSGFRLVTPADIQRTLLELTAVSITNAVSESKLANSAPESELLVCGGGAYNGLLMSRLQELLPGMSVSSTQQYGMSPDWIEASTFAWLASRTLKREKIDTGVLTGARHPVILGGVYFA